MHSATDRRLENERRGYEQRLLIIDLYKELGNIDDVTSEVDLPRRVVAEIVNTMPNREAYRKRGTSVSKTKQVLKEDLLKARHVAGEPLSIPKYRRVAQELGGLASYNTHLRAFGSWQAALEYAGIEGNPSYGKRPGTISAMECIEAIRECHKDIGIRPSYNRYQKWFEEHDDAPSGSTIRQKLGSWNTAVSCALKPERPK